MKPIDISGKKFGRLLAVEYFGNFGKENRPYWRCICDCGNEAIVKKSFLMRGLTKSCGCLLRENYMNAKYFKNADGTVRPKLVKDFSPQEKRLYSIWKGMKERCSNTGQKDSKYYSMKGIRVCDEWKNNFFIFAEWAMSNGYEDSLTIDRIDNSLGYFPDNCEWVTRAVQSSKLPGNKFLTIDGETLSISEWARKANISRATIRRRLSQGWTAEQAVKTPVRNKKLTKGA